MRRSATSSSCTTGTGAARSASYRRSLDLNPGFVPARNNYAQVLASRKRFDEALAMSEETLRLDPQSTEAWISHGMLLYYKKDFSAAEAIAERIIAQEPGNPTGSCAAEGEWRKRRAVTPWR